MRCACFFIFCLCLGAALVHAHEGDYGISANPGAVNITTGTGELGRLLQIPKSSGVRLGGLWIGDYNALVSGGGSAHHHRRWTRNSLLIIDLAIDLEQAMGWKNGLFGAEFLQFDGQATNKDAGVVQGYNSLPGDRPLDRSELYQLWILQEFFDRKLGVRVGKMVPTYHFNNVSKPVPKENPAISIPSVTGLIYTPIFVNTTLSGVIGGFYNSVYGLVVTVAPSKESYVNMGVFDGNVARGVQTGIKIGPRFNGYYFSIIEGGYGWLKPKPGIAALGGWYQSGTLKSGTQKEHGTGGIYAFGSQALWMKQTETENKGNVSGFYQLGWNNSRTLQMNIFVGMGLTGYALIPKRPKDSFGMGIAWSRLNRHLYSRFSEIMFQGYYQLQIHESVYFQPVLSYIPNPGARPDKSNVFAVTTRFTVLF